MSEEIIAKLKRLSNLEYCESSGDLQDKLEEINDLLNYHYPEVEEEEN